MSHNLFSVATGQFIKNSTMKNMFDYLVFIGRFQPFHLAHKETVDIALRQSQQVILALGSAQNERNIKNPFSAQEREQMILSNYNEADQKRIKFVHVIDVYNDVKWVKLVTTLIESMISPTDQVGLIGHLKDESSYYLQLFPNWKMVELESLKNAISATPLREAYYRGEIQAQYLPQGTIDFLQQFQQTDVYRQLQQKYQQQDSSHLSIISQN